MKETQKINYLDKQKVRNLDDQTVSSFHQIFLEKWRRGKKTLPSRGIFGKHDMISGNRLLSQARWKYHEKLCKKSVMPLSLSLWHLWHDHPPLEFTSGWCPTTHFGSVANVLKSKVFLPASRKYTTFFVRWSWFCSTLLKISCIVR